MSQRLTSESLEELLRQPASYVDDAGFTARVIADLPKRRASDRARGLILLGSTLFALALGLFVLPAGRAVPGAVTAVMAPLASMTRGPAAVAAAFAQIPFATLVLGGVAMVMLVWASAVLARE